MRESSAPPLRHTAAAERQRASLTACSQRASPSHLRWQQRAAHRRASRLGGQRLSSRSLSARHATGHAERPQSQ
eukprot:4231161-Prymnesium_polylepis.2